MADLIIIRSMKILNSYFFFRDKDFAEIETVLWDNIHIFFTQIWIGECN